MMYYLIFGIPAIIIMYVLVKFIFHFLLRGFSPFLPSRPWVVEQIMSELEIPQKNSKLIALSSGRSGFFRALEMKYINAEFLGVEPYLFSFLAAKAQKIIRRSRMKIIRQTIYHVNYRDADCIYCHLYPDQMDALGPKLKFECKPGTQIISTGFNIVHLKPKKVVDLPDRKGRLDWLSMNQKLFQSKKKKHKKEQKAYFYEI
ncbi:hypothetical protein KAU09_01060 [Candidatus Parcubacteria bacterium]|nr:hypothetical protein [Candidatus Parcubacteria bacterium]